MASVAGAKAAAAKLNAKFHAHSSIAIDFNAFLGLHTVYDPATYATYLPPSTSAFLSLPTPPTVPEMTIDPALLDLEAVRQEFGAQLTLNDCNKQADPFDATSVFAP